MSEEEFKEKMIRDLIIVIAIVCLIIAGATIYYWDTPVEEVPKWVFWIKRK